jgi:hypothetical protein
MNNKYVNQTGLVLNDLLAYKAECLFIIIIIYINIKLTIILY